MGVDSEEGGEEVVVVVVVRTIHERDGDGERDIK